MRHLEQFSVASRGGVCSICGTDRKVKDKGVIATDIHIEFEGNFDICVECVLEMGSMVGMVSSERAEAMYTRLAEYEAWTTWAEQELQDRDHTIGTLSAALARSNGVSA